MLEEAMSPFEATVQRMLGETIPPALKLVVSPLLTLGRGQRAQAKLNFFLCAANASENLNICPFL